MIRVLHIFGALNPGGVETLVMNIYRNIDRDQIQFDFALTQGKKSFYDEEVLQLGGRIFYFDTGKSIFRNLRTLLKKEKEIDVVHSHVYFYSGVIVYAAKQAGIPVRIAHAHNTSFGQANTVIRHAYEVLMRNMIKKYATHLLGCSVDACEFVFGNGCMDDPRCSVFYNAFDVDQFMFDEDKRKQIRNLYDIGSQVVIGHVGRFEEQKNHEQLVEQFAEYKKNNNNSLLLLVGRGSLMEHIKDKCNKLDILDSVVFAGAQKDTPSYYCAMDVFLFPSLYEGLGSALIEAQANGLYCITTKDLVPGETDLTGRVCFLPLEADAKVWAYEINKAKCREEAEHCNKMVKEKYDIKVGVNKLTSIYLQKED